MPSSELILQYKIAREKLDGSMFHGTIFGLFNVRVGGSAKFVLAVICEFAQKGNKFHGRLNIHRCIQQ